MVRKLVEKNIDIYSYPDEFEDSSGSVTIGDLHGNTIKLLHFLLRHKVIKFTDDISEPAISYHKFVSLYEQSGDITKLYLDKFYNYSGRNKLSDLAWQQECQKLPGIISQFNQLMSRLEINNGSVRVRLIGDELADRGSNDYFTLRILALLLDNNVQTTIMISNHNSEFLKAFDHLLKHHSFAPGGIIPEQKCSLFGLKLLLDEGVISKIELRNLVNQSWKPALKILDYTLNPDGICLFTHAPVRFEVIRMIAHQLGVTYNDTSKEMLGATIDHINVIFRQIIKDDNPDSLLDTGTIDRVDLMADRDIARAPLVYIIWNRWNASIDTAQARPALVNNYRVCYVHGHDPYQSNFEHVINLDTACGKQPRRELLRNMERARQLIVNDGYDQMLKADARQYLADVTRYKVLDSDECSLAQDKT